MIKIITMATGFTEFIMVLMKYINPDTRQAVADNIFDIFEKIAVDNNIKWLLLGCKMSREALGIIDDDEDDTNPI